MFSKHQSWKILLCFFTKINGYQSLATLTLVLRRILIRMHSQNCEVLWQQQIFVPQAV